MKIIHLSHSDTGGAGRACYRLHRALLAAGVCSRMWVNRSASDDWTVVGPGSKYSKLNNLFRPYYVAPLVRMLRTGNRILHSPAVLPSRWVHTVNASDADVVHLHWVCHEMLSVAEIGRINKPVVWTLHDMWAFCGAEHLTEDSRWRDGYRRDNRPVYESGFDLNRWTWRRKCKHWHQLCQSMQLVAPSRWMAACAGESVVFRGGTIRVIPNVLDIQRWKPVNRSLARRLMGLPAGRKLILFGALDGDRSSIKGGALLMDALQRLTSQYDRSDCELVIFGRSRPREVPYSLPTHYMGHVHDDISLILLYSAADVMVVPSRQESFCQTASEAQSCGCPVVSFDCTGLIDTVEHRVSGFRATAYNTEELASGIQWVLGNASRYRKLSVNARKKAVDCWSPDVVIPEYLETYAQAVKTRADTQGGRGVL